MLLQVRWRAARTAGGSEFLALLLPIASSKQAKEGETYCTTTATQYYVAIMHPLWLGYYAIGVRFAEAGIFVWLPAPFQHCADALQNRE